jgi:hypothetical protein
VDGVGVVLGATAMVLQTQAIAAPAGPVELRVDDLKVPLGVDDPQFAMTRCLDCGEQRPLQGWIVGAYAGHGAVCGGFFRKVRARSRAYIRSTSTIEVSSTMSRSHSSGLSSLR